MALAQKIFIALLAGFVAGLALGVGARVGMRLIALAANQPTTLTRATVGILFDFALVGIIAGLVFMLVKKYLACLGRWRGPVFGVCVLLALLPLFFSGETENRPLALALFALSFIVYGVVLEDSVSWMENRIRVAVVGHQKVVSNTDAPPNKRLQPLARALPRRGSSRR